MTFWTDEEQSRFGFAVVDGVNSPGTITTIEINGTPINIDEQKGYGFDGAFLRETGLGLASCGFGCRLVDDEDRAGLMSAKFLRAIQASPPGQPQRIRTVKHPLLDLAASFASFTARWRFTGVPFPEPADGGGIMLWLRFKNDRKQKPRTGKPLDPRNVAQGKVPNPRQEAIKGVGALIAAEIAKAKT